MKKSQLRQLIREQIKKTYLNEGYASFVEEFLSKDANVNFSNAIDNLKSGPLTKENILKLAKRYGVDPQDAIKFVKQMYKTSLDESSRKAGLLIQIKDVNDALENGEINGESLTNETELLLQQELKRLKSQLQQLVGETWNGISDPSSKHYKIYMNGDYSQGYGGEGMTKNEAIRTAKELSRTDTHSTHKIEVTPDDNSDKIIWSNEPVKEAEFKHISPSENKIKDAIKDVEKKFRLKANRDKPPQYAQLSLNKIMLSKVLGREELGKEHQGAWEKLKKEYGLR